MAVPYDEYGFNFPNGVPVSFVDQYDSKLHLLAEQRGSKFEFAFDKYHVQGQRRYIAQLGSINAQARTVRYGDTPLNNPVHMQRALDTQDFETNVLLDKQDDLRMIIAPMDKYALRQASALARIKDDICIDALYGTALAGARGEISVSLPASQQIEATTNQYTAVTTATPFNLSKQLTISEILSSNDADPSDPIYIAMNQRQLNAFMYQKEVSDANFAYSRALADGTLFEYGNMRFIITNRLGTNPVNGYDRVVAWSRPAMAFGESQPIKSRMSERDDKSYAWQVYASMTIGATRLEEKLVVTVECATSGAVN